MSFHTIRHPGTGVVYLRSDLLISRHGFSTRLGGVSRAAHTSSLNLAFGRGDEDGVVLQNLSRFGEAVGFDPASVVSVPQIHGKDVFVMDDRHRGMGYFAPSALPGGATGGDGYVTTCPDVTLGVKTADCTPILLEARCVTATGRRVVAVAALHAGWKGTVADIAGEGVTRLRQIAQSVVDPWPGDEATAGRLAIYAAIGPCIHPCCFEVQEDCLAVVRQELGRFAEPYICTTPQADGVRYALDLPGLNRALLLRAGVEETHIDVCPACTACHVDTFYSHRAQAGWRGTMLHVIQPVEA